MERENKNKKTGNVIFLNFNNNYNKYFYKVIILSLS